MADIGVFTIEQLHRLKRLGREQVSSVRGGFEWMRNDFLALVGGVLYYKVPNVITFRGQKIIWFTRDKDNYLLLNLQMITAAHQPRLRIIENYWDTGGIPQEFECPPSGRLVHALYPNGDKIHVEFWELLSIEDAMKRYEKLGYPSHQWDFTYPLTMVEIHLVVAGTDINLGPNYTSLKNVPKMQGRIEGVGGGLYIG